MSRLYITTQTDMSKTGSRANNQCSSEIRYGSKTDSNLAAITRVDWLTSYNKPVVNLTVPSNVLVKINGKVVQS